MPSEGPKQPAGAELPEFPSQRFIHNARTFLKIFQPTVVVAIVAWVSLKLKQHFSWEDLVSLYESPLDNLLGSYFYATATICLLLLVGVLKWCGNWQRGVYLVDFTCYKPPNSYRVARQAVRVHTERCERFDEESCNFQARIADRAGLGDDTYLPPVFHIMHEKNSPMKASDINMCHAREEAELVMFGAVGDLLRKTGLKTKDIDILIVNCSLFNPTPSLTSMIVNHFQLRSDIITYNLSGMGCSAGVIAIGLARELLQVYPNKNAVVVSTENITQNWYQGKERSMLIPNILFRMGGSAVYLTNRRSEKYRAKYELQRVIRVHLGANDKAYKCVFQHPDPEGIIGVELNKDLVSVASKALQHNMTRMGPLVLPWSEFIFLGINLFAAKVMRWKVKAYVPDFKTAFDHFCLHAGGRAVIEGLSRQLGLPKDKTTPSFSTLEWYGNTSSSTVWYSLGFIESCQQVRKGDIVWQVGFGSGFKCNSSVWRAMRNIKVTHEAWAHLCGGEKLPPHRH